MGRSSTGAGSRSRRRTNEHQRSRSEAGCQGKCRWVRADLHRQQRQKICTLELSRKLFRVQTTFSDTFIVACCDSGLIEKVLSDNYENLKFFLEAMLNND